MFKAYQYGGNQINGSSLFAEDSTIAEMKVADSTPRVVQLWWSTVQSAQPHHAELLRLLDAEERLRARRFLVNNAGSRFVASRAMLRLILGRQIGVAPDELVFSYGDHGKPRVAEGLPHFSLSHSANTIVVAVAAEELGVDVEERRELANAARLARRICTEGEFDTLLSLPEAEFETMLLRLWTIKEAVLKYIGTGITGGMRSVEVEGDLDSASPKVRVGGEIGVWTARLIPLPVDALCTAAVAGTGWRFDLAEFEWLF
jgi:4'-phosphopantetheinyl transferase